MKTSGATFAAGETRQSGRRAGRGPRAPGGTRPPPQPVSRGCAMNEPRRRTILRRRRRTATTPFIVRVAYGPDTPLSARRSSLSLSLRSRGHSTIYEQRQFGTVRRRAFYGRRRYGCFFLSKSFFILLSLSVSRTRSSSAVPVVVRFGTDDRETRVRAKPFFRRSSDRGSVRVGLDVRGIYGETRRARRYHESVRDVLGIRAATPAPGRPQQQGGQEQTPVAAVGGEGRHLRR